MKSFAVDVAARQFSKAGEDICGDAIKVSQTPDSTIIVLSDGLGSGVKANVLATLTVEIASGLFQGDLSFHEIVETLIATLPVCRWRNIAYSTFSIVRIYDTGKVTVAKYDSPDIIHIHAGKPVVVEGTEFTVYEKTIRESYFRMRPDDMLALFSDGIVYSGVGQGLKMGWQEEGIFNYLAEIAPSINGSVSGIADSIADKALDHWAGRPGDDGTVLCARYRKARITNVITGPPSDRLLVPKMMKDFAALKGSKIVSGGTTSHLVAEHLKQPLEIDESYLDTDLPPAGRIQGIDLVTEGILTLSRAREYLRNGAPADQRNAAVTLVERLLDADGLRFMVGMARNAAHQNTGLPDSIFLRKTVVEDIVAILREMGKEVELTYY